MNINGPSVSLGRGGAIQAYNGILCGAHQGRPKFPQSWDRIMVPHGSWALSNPLFLKPHFEGPPIIFLLLGFTKLGPPCKLHRFVGRNESCLRLATFVAFSLDRRHLASSNPFPLLDPWVLCGKIAKGWSRIGQEVRATETKIIGVEFGLIVLCCVVLCLSHVSYMRTFSNIGSCILVALVVLCSHFCFTT